MINGEIDKSDIEYVLSEFNILNKEYCKYIFNVIETTSIILNQLELLNDNKSSIFRVDRQLGRGLLYIKKILEFIEKKIEYKRVDRHIKSRNNYINKVIDFFEFLAYNELVSYFKIDEYKKIIVSLKIYEESNILIKRNDVVAFLKSELLSFECLFDIGKYLDSIEDMDGYSRLINLFNTPTKNDILKAGIYHIARIFFDNELAQTSELSIDYNNKENKYYLKISSQIIVNIFKNYGGKMDYITDDFNLLSYTERWTSFMYRDNVLGLIGQLPKQLTGYTTISSYYEYNLNTKEGCKLYIFPDEKLEFNF